MTSSGGHTSGHGLTFGEKIARGLNWTLGVIVLLMVCIKWWEVVAFLVVFGLLSLVEEHVHRTMFLVAFWGWVLIAAYFALEHYGVVGGP